MKEGLLKKIYDTVDNQWLFVMKATKKYKEEFSKTAKIGEPPKIEDILEQTLSNGSGTDIPEEKSSASAPKKKKAEAEKKTPDKKED